MELSSSVDRVVCCNCFRSGHAQDSFTFPLATIIEESPQKLLQAVHSERDVVGLEGLVASVETVEAGCVQGIDGGVVEIDDERLNLAYDELLTQEFNPDAEDFEDDTEDSPCEIGEFHAVVPL